MIPIRLFGTRAVAMGAVGSGLLFVGGYPPPADAMTFEQLSQKANALADRDYEPRPKAEVPDFLKDLDYNAYQEIDFRGQAAPWADEDLRFQIRLYHPGYLYTDPVAIHLMEGERVREFEFSSSRFDYGSTGLADRVAEVSDSLGFAGVQFYYPVGRLGDLQEVASFLGASYFRLLGGDQRYGASARGLAIDTAEPTGEEFPRFTDLWIRKPGAESDYLTLLALLDSPSVAGAYQLVIKPGRRTDIEVQARLYFRSGDRKIGFAPLTSMFLVGENRTRYIPDYRPEVHDSDGLLLHQGDDNWIWRPLTNPQKTHQVRRFPVDRLQGFGLLQRDRRFAHYQDLETRYDLHPSLWITPHGEWGGGAVELVEIPTTGEGNDNIVAYWVFHEEIEAGAEMGIHYTVSAYDEEARRPPLVRVMSTRLAPKEGQEGGDIRFVLDFGGPLPPEAPRNPKLACRVTTSQGEIKGLVTQPNEVTGGWRTTFQLVGAEGEEAELRAFLHSEDRRLSETWVYHFTRPGRP